MQADTLQSCGANVNRIFTPAASPPSPHPHQTLLTTTQVEALRNNQVIESSVWAPGILGRAALTKLSKDAPAS
eukprot:366333-Chlamydomonas_euryale.AAC.12